jgi:CheY-like chemotaxis protein
MEIDNAARKAAYLTKQILAFSDHQIFDIKPTSVNVLLNNFASFIRPMLGERYSVELRESDFDLRPCLDGAEIEQALTNIVINSSEAMPQGGKISITTALLDEAPPQVPFPVKADHWLQISVADTGIGIDPELVTRIFDPFFTTKTAGQGHGLGLAIAYGIIRQHDGWIDAESTPGHGSTFHIFLPVRIDCVPSTLAETPGSVHRGETILIAEDTELLKKMLKTILADMGYDVLTASDGAEAIELYRQNKDRVRLMMLDMVMPKKGGREVYETLAGEAIGVKFLMTSGYSSDDSIRNFTQRHGVPLIPKPYDPEELGKKIQQLLGTN